MSVPSLELKQISKRFGAAEVLRDVSLSVKRGEFLSVLGPSGCGKSTLLRIIAGLETESGGEVRIDGRDVRAAGPAERDIAMVFQSYALYPHLTVRDNIALPLRVRRLTRAQRLFPVLTLAGRSRAVRAGIDDEVARLAELLELGALLERRPHELSGGQRQRVALARAMIRNPSVFLMDEPLSNLDARLRVQMRAEIVALHRRLGTTFVYVTHDQVEAMTMSDRVAVMMGGRVAQLGPPAEIYRAPVDVGVAGFVGTPQINLLPATSDAAGRVSIGPVATGLVVEEPVASLRVGMRPENARPAARGAQPALVGTVKHVENLGSEYLIHLTSEHFELLVARWQSGEAPPEFGSSVAVAFEPSSLLVFDRGGRRLGTSLELRGVARAS